MIVSYSDFTSGYFLQELRTDYFHSDQCCDFSSGFSLGMNLSLVGRHWWSVTKVCIRVVGWIAAKGQEYDSYSVLPVYVLQVRQWYTSVEALGVKGQEYDSYSVLAVYVLQVRQRYTSVESLGVKGQEYDSYSVLLYICSGMHGLRNDGNCFPGILRLTTIHNNRRMTIIKYEKMTLFQKKI